MIPTREKRAEAKKEETASEAHTRLQPITLLYRYTLITLIRNLFSSNIHPTFGKLSHARCMLFDILHVRTTYVLKVKDESQQSDV